jgi:hypothetical protein
MKHNFLLISDSLYNSSTHTNTFKTSPSTFVHPPRHPLREPSAILLIGIRLLRQVFSKDEKVLLIADLFQPQFKTFTRLPLDLRREIWSQVETPYDKSRIHGILAFTYVIVPGRANTGVTNYPVVLSGNIQRTCLPVPTSIKVMAHTPLPPDIPRG